MKAVAALFASPLVICTVQGATAQAAFRHLVDRASRVEVRRTVSSGRGVATLFSSEEPKRIAEVIAAFQMEDSECQVSADGEEIITLVCYCLPEYTVTFTVGGKNEEFGLKHSVEAILLPVPLGVDYMTDLQLTNRSSKVLTRMIATWERRANSR